MIHASVASVLEKHILIPDCDKADLLGSVYATMRFTLCEGKPKAFGLDENAGLRTATSIVRTTGDIQWIWD